MGKNPETTISLGKDPLNNPLEPLSVTYRGVRTSNLRETTS